MAPSPKLLSPIYRISSEVLLEIFGYLDGPRGCSPKDSQHEYWNSIYSTPAFGPDGYNDEEESSSIKVPLRPQFSCFGRIGEPHTEHPVATVYQQWRALSKSGTFDSVLLLGTELEGRVWDCKLWDYRSYPVLTKGVGLSRIVAWLEATEETRLVVRIESMKHLDSTRFLEELVKHAGRFRSFDVPGVVFMDSKLLSHAPGHPTAIVLSHLSLSFLNRAPADALSNLSQEPTASIELPSLRLIHISGHLPSVLVRIFAPKAAILELRIREHLPPSVWSMLSTCFPSLRTLYALSTSIVQHAAPDYAIPFASLLAIHVDLRGEEYSRERKEVMIPSLDNCKKLQIVCIYDAGYKVKLALPPSCAIGFKFQRFNPGMGNFKPELLRSLPHLRVCVIMDEPAIHWGIGIVDELPMTQTETVNIINALTRDAGLCPHLTELSLIKAAGTSKSYMKLLEARPSLTMTLTGGNTFRSLTGSIVRADKKALKKKMRTLAIFNNAEQFYGDCVRSLPNFEELVEHL
jgi:hypothetical protein